MSTTAENQQKALPALQDMGINNAHEISGYTLRPEGSQRDVLKIKYKRAKGSFLPQSRTYKFGRSLKTVVADGGTARMEHTYEISPFLLKAVAELDSLVSENKKVSAAVKSRIGEELVGELIAEFDELEGMVMSGDVGKVDAPAIAARFSRLRAQIASL